MNGKDSKWQRQTRAALMRVADHIDAQSTCEQDSMVLRATSLLWDVACMGRYRAKLAEIAARCESSAATPDDAAYLRRTTDEYFGETE